MEEKSQLFSASHHAYVRVLFSLLGQHPCLCNKGHSNYKNREVRDAAWDAIAADVYEDQWNRLSYAGKANRAKYLQKKFTPEDLAAMNMSGGTSDEAILDIIEIVESDLDEPTAGDTEATAVGSQPARTEQAVKDEDEEFLLLYLLPTYKLLTASEKREMLYKCYCIMRNRYRNGTNAASTSSNAASTSSSSINN
ncbi:Alcohol dehydrogenase transcription factor Myb/SANT-like [Popillia japonica]|uniref:Alcohol dehydrogenase transcription factor Myb/SANT-like n=1 Tax=Popillia japonica TaxID=7064 RepID=A0AAW1IZR6_POPJA